jgi:hypothetical protein
LKYEKFEIYEKYKCDTCRAQARPGSIAMIHDSEHDIQNNLDLKYHAALSRYVAYENLRRTVARSDPHLQMRSVERPLPATSVRQNELRSPWQIVLQGVP